MKKFLISFCLILAAQYAFAQEGIQNFAVDLTVNKDSSVTVREDITVYALGTQIQRGIYRALPSKNFEKPQIISLSMDGAPHPFSVKEGFSSLIISFGDDTELFPGLHTYSFTYKVPFAVDFLKSYDEIYWNVTGNNWSLPIAAASVAVHLPQGATPLEEGISLYSGEEGAKDSFAKQDGYLSYSMTQPLTPGEGFTVSIPFTKGAVKEAGVWEKITSFGTPWFLLIFLLSLYAYYFIFWFLKGRDEKDISVRQYKPPKGVSPVFARFMRKRGFDEKSFCTGVVSLSLQGKLHLEGSKDIILRRAQDASSVGLTDDEAKLFDKLFPSGANAFELSSSGEEILKTVVEMNKYLHEKGKLYIDYNRTYIWPPLAALVALQVLILLKAPLPFSIVLTAVNLFYLFFMMPVVMGAKGLIKIIVLVIGTFAFCTTMLPNSLITPASFFTEITFMFGVWGFLVFCNTIDRLNKEGRLLKGLLDGFYQYMSVAEEGRAALSDVEAKDIFCDYLAFAFAFDMESKWFDQFTKRVNANLFAEDVRVRKSLTCLALPKAVRSSVGAYQAAHGGGGGGSFGGGCSGGGHRRGGRGRR